MSFNPTFPVSSCPPWCDPRAHIQDDAEQAEHRTAGMSWKPVAADTELTVRTTQLEDSGPYGCTSAPMVRLQILDTESTTLDGREITAGTDLDPADARMLAAALVCEAERVEALTRRLRAVA